MDSIPSSVSATPSGSSGAAMRKRKLQAAKVDPIEELDAAAKYKEKEVAFAGLECAIKQLQHPPQRTDDFQIFANYIASELRKIKIPAYAQATQRELIKLLLDRMENEPVKSNSSLGNIFLLHY